MEVSASTILVHAHTNPIEGFVSQYKSLGRESTCTCVPQGTWV